MSFKVISSLFILNIAFFCSGHDTLKLNLDQADSLFLKKNFFLLASSMHVEAQKALVIQAKVYPNPIFTADFNAYDPENNVPFHVGSTGQKGFQFEQLLLLGGKRKNEIQLANTNAQLAQLEFQQLLNQLKFRLHSDLFSAGQFQVLLKRYNHQLQMLETLLSAYETQANKGNLPLKDVVRLKGAYLKLNNDRAELYKDYFAIQASLQTLLQSTSIIEFQFSEADIEKYIRLNSLEEIKTAAMQNRPELLIIENNKLLAEQYFKYQKSLAVPDVNLFTSYDQRGGAFQNQVNIGFSIPLPLWNRNQGNIKFAQYNIMEADYTLQARQNELISEVQNAYYLYTQTVSEYQKAKSIYNEDFEITLTGMTENFQKRNVSIVEFIDFFEAYNEMLTELTRIKVQLVISGEQLNHLTGKSLY